MIAGKSENVKPKIGGDIACSLCAGNSHGTTNQASNYVLVTEERDDDSGNEV